MSVSNPRNHVFPKTITRKELMVGGSDALLRKLLYEITALANRIETMRATFAKRLNITPPQYNVLLYIAQHQGERGLTTTDVAKALRVSSAHVVKETNHLISFGLLRKDQNPDDGRSVLLSTTGKGMADICDLAPILQSVNDELFGSLTTEQFKQMSALIGAVLEDAEVTLVKLPAYLASNG